MRKPTVKQNEKIVEDLKKFIVEEFKFGLNNVVIATHYGAYECVEHEDDDYNTSHSWKEIHWVGDNPKEYELALVLHDSGSNIIGYDEDYRDNDTKWGEFNEAKNGYFAEPYNSWKMSITRDILN